MRWARDNDIRVHVLLQGTLHLTGHLPYSWRLICDGLTASRHCSTGETWLGHCVSISASAPIVVVVAVVVVIDSSSSSLATAIASLPPLISP